MSEMLANQYFMVRRFKDAEKAYEAVLAAEPGSKSARKKLIICYLNNGRVNEGMQLFYNLIKEDIEYIIKTDIIADDCPCPELIDKFDMHNESGFSDIRKKEVISILWLYCDILKSHECFIQLSDRNPAVQMYKDVLTVYHSYLETHPELLTP